MKVECRCPKCETIYIVDEVRLGRRAHCARCGERFVLESITRKVSPPPVSQTAAIKAEIKKAPPKFPPDPIVIKVLDKYSDQLALSPDEKLLNFVSSAADPDDVHAGLLLTTKRVMFFDQRQDFEIKLGDVTAARVVLPSMCTPVYLAGLTVFGKDIAEPAIRVQINDNLFCLAAPRYVTRRLLKNLSLSTGVRATMPPTCAESDIVFVDQSEKGITLDVPSAVAIEFPDECARCGAAYAPEAYHVKPYYAPYCTEHFRQDKGVGKKGCAVQVVKSKKLITRIFFARGEYAQKFIVLNTTGAC